MFDQDKLNFALTKKSLDILSSLVDKRSSKTSYDGEKLVGSTISSVFHLFDELMHECIPDLYQSEWLLISKSLFSDSNQQQLPCSIKEMKRELVLSLEDMESNKLYQVNSFELSKKISGFSNVELCAIYYHIQKSFIAKRKS